MKSSWAEKLITVLIWFVQEMIRSVNDEINLSKREVQILRQDKEQLENVLSHKSTEVRKNLQVEAQR